MGTRKGWTGWLCGVAMMLVWAAPALAEEASSSQTTGPIQKLGRGIANVATCPLELIRTPELVGRQQGYLAAMSVGLLEGAWRTILRGVAGVFDVVTFYAEIPKDFQPLVKPEFVWAHGNWTE